MGRGRWKEQVKCKDWSALDWQMSKMQHYTLPWSECRLDDLFSFSNIEFMKKKKDLHSIKLLRVLFWKENVIVGVDVWK